MRRFGSFKDRGINPAVASGGFFEDQAVLTANVIPARDLNLMVAGVLVKLMARALDARTVRRTSEVPRARSPAKSRRAPKPRPCQAGTIPIEEINHRAADLLIS